MEGPEFILFGTTHLVGLAVIFATMIAFPKITNNHFFILKNTIHVHVPLY